MTTGADPVNRRRRDDVVFPAKRGRLDIGARRDATGNPVLLVAAHGIVGVGLVRAALARAGEFAHAHPGGWTYLVDTTDVTVASPANALVLRRIRTLPHLDRYIVVVPGDLQRRVLSRLAPIVAADEVVPALPPLAGN